MLGGLSASLRYSDIRLRHHAVAWYCSTTAFCDIGVSRGIELTIESGMKIFISENYF